MAPGLGWRSTLQRTGLGFYAGNRTCLATEPGLGFYATLQRTWVGLQRKWLSSPSTSDGDAHARRPRRATIAATRADPGDWCTDDDEPAVARELKCFMELKDDLEECNDRYTLPELNESCLKHAWETYFRCRVGLPRTPGL